jgi:hypothetical protein
MRTLDLGQDFAVLLPLEPVAMGVEVLPAMLDVAADPGRVEECPSTVPKTPTLYGQIVSRWT